MGGGMGGGMGGAMGGGMAMGNNQMMGSQMMGGQSGGGGNVLLVSNLDEDSVNGALLDVGLFAFMAMISYVLFFMLSCKMLALFI